MDVIEEHRCFNGSLCVYEHESEVLGCQMKFSVFFPPQVKDRDCPAVFFLSGLTCTHENFTTKAGAYKKAAELGLIVIALDTSPRGDDVPDDADSYDFGKGAGFYINATQQPWAKHYQMESYIADELYGLLVEKYPIDKEKVGISGHSMGGHGALTLYFKYPEKFSAVSAFSPIVAPRKVPWGEKAFSRYLGDDQDEWRKHDASVLVADAKVDRSRVILIDQGKADDFLTEQLRPELFELACQDAGQALELRMHDGYDHSYYFIATFIDDHLTHFANVLMG